MDNKQKLAIIALGKSNSGKSNTWYEIFGRTIRTGWKRLYFESKMQEVFVRNASFEEAGDEIAKDIFVRNASFEEYGDEVEDFFDWAELPDIVFCSVQYIEKGIRTINWFKDNGYFLYIQWLNPGYRYENKYPDFLGFEAKFKDYGFFVQHTGKEKTKRVEEIKQFLGQWIK